MAYYAHFYFFVKTWLQLDTDIKKYQVGIEVEAH